MNYHSLVIFIAAMFFYSACIPPARESDPSPDLYAKGIYVVNEGNFQWGNASVSFYNLSSGVVTRDIFSLKNNETTGDVAQSLSFYKDHFYLVVNNSNKIEILDTNFVRTSVVTGFDSPRYIAFNSDGKGYVSDLYAKGVSVLNTASKVIDKKIIINYWTEEMLSFKDTIYVTSPQSMYLYLINTSKDVLTDSINIGYGSSAVTIDHNNHLWIITSGKKDLAIKPSLLALDVFSRKILLRYEFNSYDVYPSKLNYNPVNQYVYWIDNGIKRFDTNNLSGKQEEIISADQKSFYGLAIDPFNGNVIASDAGDYTQRSAIYMYSKDGGVPISSFTAGIISGYMLVK
ncbi:MAG: surface layer protein [Cytophagales bacterium]|nr:surface layer protein [Cytophaga sp.]